MDRRFALLASVVLATSCSSTKDNAVDKMPPDTFNTKFGKLKTKQKINALKKAGAQTGFTSELNASIESLENGGSDATAAEAARLESQRVSSGLSDKENQVLKYLKRGVPRAQAELQIKEDDGSISETERVNLMNMKFPPGEKKPDPTLTVKPGRHSVE